MGIGSHTLSALALALALTTPAAADCARVHAAAERETAELAKAQEALSARMTARDRHMADLARQGRPAAELDRVWAEQHADWRRGAELAARACGVVDRSERAGCAPAGAYEACLAKTRRHLEAIALPSDWRAAYGN